MIPRSVGRASIVAVPSEFVRTSVIGAFDVDPGRVVVVPHGVPSLGVTPRSEADLRARYGLGDRRVLLYPAATFPHKQHLFLVELLAGPLAREEVILVLIGGEGRAERMLREAMRSGRMADRIVRPGRVPDADRDGLIALADALLFPSEYEGFGAPIIEAMSIGTPVICSDRAALPEVAGDAALIVPLELEAWARALRQLPQDRAGLVARGKRRAAHFSPEASGAALADVYRMAAAGGDPTPGFSTTVRAGSARPERS